MPLQIERLPARPVPAAERVPGALLHSEHTRSVTVWADDSSAALTWLSNLAGEGLSLETVAAPRPGSDAHVLFVHTGLASQLARLRQQRQAVPVLPLLVVCGGLRELDEVLALEMGADDVVSTSVSPSVVAARLRALCRRLPAATTPTQPRELRFGALCLLSLERRVLLNGTPVPLSEGEFEVLWLLASQAGRAVSRGDILRRVRGLEDQPHDRSVDSRVYRIRAKLGDPALVCTRIRTVRNYGYAFSPRDW